MIPKFWEMETEGENKQETKNGDRPSHLSGHSSQRHKSFLSPLRLPESHTWKRQCIMETENIPCFYCLLLSQALTM